MGVTRRVLALVTALVLALPAQADIVIPSEPRLRDIPKTNLLGKRVRGVTLFATNVFRRGNGEIYVLYGFIVGQMNGDSSYFYWNDKIGLTCYGITTRQKDGSGVGQNRCEENGVAFADTEFQVTSGKYGRLRGQVTARFVEVDGGFMDVVQSWKAARPFPDPMKMIAELP